MPPGRAYNWLTVGHSALQVLDHALAYRTAQLQLNRVSQNQRRSQNNQGDNGPEAFRVVQQSTLLEANEAWLRQLQFRATPLPPPSVTVLEAPGSPGATAASSPTGLSPQAAAAAAAFSTVDAPDPVVLEAETKIPQRHDPLPQVVAEVSPPQDVRPTTILRLNYSRNQSAPGIFFPYRVRKAPSILQSPIFPYWATISLWRYAYTRLVPRS